MPWADLSEGFSGLKQWSEPVIYDRLIAAYRKLISDHELSSNLTRLHARVWRALIRGDMATVAAVAQQGIASPEHAAFVARLNPASSQNRP